jgi:hypothetical protein
MLWTASRSSPIPVGLLVVIPGLALVLLRARRRARVPVALRDYRDALRRCGLRLEPGETPRELLARAQASDVTTDRLQALRQATGDHERSRYAARGAARSTGVRG